jgi:LacI family transcriptional regulator
MAKESVDMSVTITDIARKLGVSHPVVSKVLNGGRSTVGVSEGMRRKVLDAATEMGYRPHAAGQWLKSKRFHAVGVVVGSEDPNFYLPQHTIASFSRALAAHDYTCMFVNVGGLGKEELMACPLVKRNQVDSLVVSYASQPSEEMIRALEGLPVPIVWMHHGPEHNLIRLDEEGAARMLVDHLKEQGHDRILFIDYSTGLTDPASLARLRGFEDRAHALGVDPILMAANRVARVDRLEATRKWITRKGAPKAVIANSLSTAIAVLQSALHLGMKVPEDIAIATFDDGLHHTLGLPNITAVIAPHAKLGEVAGEMSVTVAKDRLMKAAPVLLDFELRVCGSTVLTPNKGTSP